VIYSSLAKYEKAAPAPIIICENKLFLEQICYVIVKVNKIYKKKIYNYHKLIFIEH